MGVAVLQPRDCLTDPFSRNILTPPQRQKKPTSNRRRRSPPRHEPVISPSLALPPGSKKNLNHNNQNNNIVSIHVTILKRGEEMGRKIPDLTVDKPDLRSSRRTGSDPVMIPLQNRVSDRKSTPALFYAGPVTSTSPPPSEVPLPAFFAKKSVSMFNPTDDATNNLIRILRLDIA